MAAVAAVAGAVVVVVVGAVGVGVVGVTLSTLVVAVVVAHAASLRSFVKPPIRELHRRIGSSGKAGNDFGFHCLRSFRTRMLG
ncbi:hypothetical protein GCM10009839_54900 [Catenulispora yoronensis]|uniref:Secreted protein n=1 Tax=Catenulispora yoronensis TaxID=450799 RepID=A0ABP5GGW0_9ACTN